MDLPLIVDLSDMGARHPKLFSVIDEALGPCDDTLEARLQAELKSAFHRHCNKLGKTMGERLRELIALDALGHEHVGSLVSKRFAVIGMYAPNASQTDVGTTDKTSVKP